VVFNDNNCQPPPRRGAAGRRGFAVADLGSTNGTKVNGLRIDGERTLSDGDIITVGGTHLRFEAS
jgi:pSer/pThr/pTyr-binding forkhead associated (FHA) protein